MWTTAGNPRLGYWFLQGKWKRTCVPNCFFFNLRKIVASLWNDPNNPTFMKWLKPAGLMFGMERPEPRKRKGSGSFLGSLVLLQVASCATEMNVLYSYVWCLGWNIWKSQAPFFLHTASPWVYLRLPTAWWSRGGWTSHVVASFLGMGAPIDWTEAEGVSWPNLGHPRISIPPRLCIRPVTKASPYSKWVELDSTPQWKREQRICGHL